MITERTKKIRKQILRDVIHHPNDIAAHIAEIFSISRQAVNNHLKALVSECWLEAKGTTRNKIYSLGLKRENDFVFQLDSTASESDIFFTHFNHIIDGLNKNISDIVFYGFTEIVNNAIDHSQGKVCLIHMTRDSKEIKLTVLDDGEGIFKRIKRLKNLCDEKQAILELSKGKLTTDPSNHSGQGIFFTSRMFDIFAISSSGLFFSHNHKNSLDVLLDDRDVTDGKGTYVAMSIALDSTRTDTEVFEAFSEGDEFAFNKTIIPVALAKFGEEQLVSRSQAKRLLTRIEHFTFVLFDFKGVETIGQAFADEIFRVYHLRHPEITLSYDNVNTNIVNMINRAKSST
jgi:anti-sigma regulatory factor (Ser/Thr protein kinase)